MRDLIGKQGVIGILVCLYALVFGEVFVRELAPVPIIPRYVTGAPYGVRVGMPNMTFWQTTPETRVQVRTNSRGIRADREYPYEKPPGTCRIVIFGDSFFVGYEVNVEDSFASLLEKRLNESGYRCEVINLAVSGFGTSEMLVTLQQEGLKYHPDVVLFSSHITDLDDNLRSALHTLDVHGDLVRKNASFLPGIRLSDELSKFFVYRWVVENSQLYSAVRERAAYYVKARMLSFKKHAEPSMGVSARESGSDAGEPASRFPQRLNLRLLEEARRTSESNGAHFCVLEIPFNRSRTEFDRMLPDYDPKVAGELHVVSPLAEFQSQAGTSRMLFYEKGHGHLTPQGNRLLADVFFSHLRDTGWLEAWRKPDDKRR